MKQLLSRLIPFILLGVAIVAIALGIMLFAYLLFFGFIIGLILFAIIRIRDYFFPAKKVVKHKNKSGRIIDSDDWKEL